MSSEDVFALATGREKLLDIILSEMKVCLKREVISTLCFMAKRYR